MAATDSVLAVLAAEASERLLRRNTVRTLATNSRGEKGLEM
jgi:hypothetical protein